MGIQRETLRRMATTFRVRSVLAKQCLAECLGTLIHTMLSCGAMAQYTLSRGEQREFLTLTFTLGFAVALGILVTGKVSGAHLNPAVTFALCLLACEPWIKFPFFFVAQTLGAFFGSGIMFGLYHNAIMHYGNNQLTIIGPNSTAAIFTTYPSEDLTVVNGFLDHVIGTAALIFCILTIADPLKRPVATGLEAFTIGFVVLIVGLSMGFNSKYCLNPARDIGPRLFSAMAGWGYDVFSTGNYWFWVPVLSPIVGAMFGVLVYQFMVGLQVETKSNCTSHSEETVKLTSVKAKGRR
ncbi:aquaporin-3 [Callorhinchus milii]|uniref:Aquaporin-3 n=1 Tax=Callorhinchus milii TaxID=7868 RepID=V9KQ42_CALMI|nr:aquaporin-3 [Callorhinchus milii]|eukprot:gi/632958931/ref/XP_007895330.1/ PREDICTED: aquaporin-3-like [Callorhinchus milii]